MSRTPDRRPFLPVLEPDCRDGPFPWKEMRNFLPSTYSTWSERRFRLSTRLMQVTLSTTSSTHSLSLCLSLSLSLSHTRPLIDRTRKFQHGSEGERAKIPILYIQCAESIRMNLVLSHIAWGWDCYHTSRAVDEPEKEILGPAIMGGYQKRQGEILYYVRFDCLAYLLTQDPICIGATGPSTSFSSSSHTHLSVQVKGDRNITKIDDVSEPYVMHEIKCWIALSFEDLSLPVCICWDQHC